MATITCSVVALWQPKFLAVLRGKKGENVK